MKSTFQKLKAAGVWGTLDALMRRISPPRLASFQHHKALLAGKYGLEIGGPSSIFSARGLFPVYPIASRIDNCTFSQHTVWEGEVQEGAFTFDASKSPGKQYIMEARDLSRFESGSFDFVASSHVLEHVANPLLALNEWIRVLKEGGLFVLILPHKDNTFDHARPVTSLDHLIEDFSGQITEADMTHLEEVLRFHDLQLDPEAGGYDTFKARSIENGKNRCIHHHVFDTQLAVRLVDHMALQILSVDVAWPYHIVIAAQKPAKGVFVDNRKFMTLNGAPRHAFPWDKKIQ